jgi:hypothetical protein
VHGYHVCSHSVYKYDSKCFYIFCSFNFSFISSGMLWLILYPFMFTMALLLWCLVYYWNARSLALPYAIFRTASAVHCFIMVIIHIPKLFRTTLWSPSICSSMLVPYLLLSVDICLIVRHPNEVFILPRGECRVWGAFPAEDSGCDKVLIGHVSRA